MSLIEVLRETEESRITSRFGAEAAGEASKQAAELLWGGHFYGVGCFLDNQVETWRMHPDSRGVSEDVDLGPLP